MYRTVVWNLDETRKVWCSRTGQDRDRLLYILYCAVRYGTVWYILEYGRTESNE